MRAAHRAPAVLSAFLALSGWACASSKPVDRTTPLPDGTREFLIRPLSGYVGDVPVNVRTELESGYDALVQASRAEAAGAVAARLLAADPDLAPALVLAGEADLARGAYRAAADRLAPVARAAPGYAAAGLALARACELAGDPVCAYDNYLQLGDLPAAARRAPAVRAAALQAARLQVDDALARQRLDIADTWRERLAGWAPDDPITVDAERAIAVANGDANGELDALRRLTEPAVAPTRELLERRAELEVDVGDPQAGVDLYQELLREHPDDPELVAGLAGAQFRWRLEVLPPEVAQLVNRPELSRGDFATLLYWLVPGARSGRPESGTIVTDVPESHPQRAAVLRVVNLGLLPLLDATLHRFGPEESMRRAPAFEALLRLIASRSNDAASCAEPVARAAAVSSERVCAGAVACGLIAEPDECLPQAPLDGRTARRVLQRALDLASTP